jgi:hypothetical protein
LFTWSPSLVHGLYRWLHDDPKKLPSTDPKLLVLAISTGERNADGTPVFTFAHNRCGTKARENTLRENEPNVYPSMSLNRLDGTTRTAAASVTNSSSAVKMLSQIIAEGDLIHPAASLP